MSGPHDADSGSPVTPDRITIEKMVNALSRSALCGKLVLQGLTYTVEATNGGEGRKRAAPNPVAKSLLFALEEGEDLVDQAVRWNQQPGTNVYISAGLRRESLEAYKPGENEDTIAVVALKADFDNEGAYEAAVEKLEAAGLTPSFIAITATVPYRRAHVWWMLDEPETDFAAVEEVEDAIRSWLDGDDVSDRRRVMRLPGSVNWATKPKRINEVTQLIDGRPAAYSFNEIRNLISKLPSAASPTEGASPPLLKGHGAASASYEQLVADAKVGPTWHVPTRTLTASLASKGLRRDQIAPLARTILEDRQGWGSPDQRAQLNDLIQGAIKKFSPASAANDNAPSFNVEAWQFKDPAVLPQRPWIYGRYFCRGLVTLTLAPGGVGKSSLAIAEAIAMCAGEAFLETEIPRGPMRVLYMNLEDPKDELDRRAAAVCQEYSVTEQKLGGRLFLHSGIEAPLLTAGQDASGKVALLNESVFTSLEEEIARHEIDMVVIDPFVSSHACNENDNVIMDKITKRWAKLALRCNVAVHIVHHTRKEGNQKHEMDADSGRGASSVSSAARVVRVLHPMSKAQAEERQIPFEQRRQYFRVATEKQNLAPHGGGGRWFRMTSVDLGNGTLLCPSDTVGVPKICSLPPVVGLEVSDERKAACLEAIAKGQFGQSEQAADWAGHAIAKTLDLNSAEKPGKGKIKDLLKRWVADGSLVVEQVKDSARGKVRPMLRVPKSGDRDAPHDDDAPHPESDTE
jgi:hypothetical protein